MRRRRLARNHVRRLLRGTTWYETQLRRAETARQTPGWGVRLLAAARRRTCDALHSLHERISRSDSGHARRLRSLAASLRDRTDPDRRRRASTALAAPFKYISHRLRDLDVGRKAEIDRRLPLQVRDEFQYPLRLKMACALSLWIALMFLAVVANVLIWVQSALRFACTLRPSIQAAATHTDGVSDFTELSSIALVPMLLIGGSPLCTDEEARTITSSILLGIMWAVPPLLYLLNVRMWWCIFAKFRSHTFELRSGRYFVDRTHFREGAATRYIGFQAAHAIVGLSLQIAVATCVLIPLVVVVLSAPIYRRGSILPESIWHSFWATLQRLVWFVLVGVIAPVLFQFFCDHFIFFRRSWILHRAVYAAYDYNFIYINAALGVANTIFRMLMLFVTFVHYFARLDKTLMPGPIGFLWRYDFGFGAYIGMLLMDHRNNNPVVMVFTELLVERFRVFRLVVQRRRRRLYAGAPRDPHEGPSSECDGSPKDAAYEGEAAPSAARVRWHNATIKALDYRRRVRNRWRLLKLLFFNPDLCRLRSHALLAERERRAQQSLAIKQAEQERAEEGELVRLEAADVTAALHHRAPRSARASALGRHLSSRHGREQSQSLVLIELGKTDLSEKV